MYKLLLATFVLELLLSCNGGRCVYKDVPFKATIVSIEKDTTADSTLIHSEYSVKLATNIPHRDTLDLREMTNQIITKDFLEDHHLTEGTVIEGIANIITSGTCDPDGGYRFTDSTLNNSNNY